ncbi:hypothetical protein UlMin_038599 [Ulmus minor]
MDRLTMLRGKGMPSLYSWSCKRSYKNGYVWNDLAENDIIYPAEGVEFVLKGSELLEGCSERFQQLQVRQIKPIPTGQNRGQEEPENSKYDHRDYDEEEEEYEDEEKISYTSSTTPHSRCSRGVSTDELEEEQPQNHMNKPQESNPSSILITNKHKESHNRSTRFEDGDPVAVSESGTPGRSSVLLQLIACGSSTVAKAKSSGCVKQQVNANTALRNSNGGNLQKVVVFKSAIKMADEEMINYISENPRFGNLQGEEKEYFSGSIVEAMKEERAANVPVLKRSNSYNQERSTKAGLEETSVEEEKRVEKASIAGKCIPLKRSPASSKHELKKCWN